jgi:uncharacterized protein YjiK
MEALESRAMLAAFDLSEYIRLSDVSEFAEAGLLQVSGAAYVPVGSEEHLFVIRNTPDNIREYRLDERNAPEFIRTITLTGFGNNTAVAGDTEAITYLGPDGSTGQNFAIVEERIGRIQLLTIPNGTTNIDVDLEDLEAIEPSPTIVDTGNDGLEGIAYRANDIQDPDDDLFYVAKEEGGNNRGVWQVERDGSATHLLICASPIDPEETECIEDTDLYDIVADVSDIHYGNVNGVDTLFVLSEKSPGSANHNQVLRVELEGTFGLIVDTLTLPDGTDLRQPEGITFTPNGSDMIVVGEPGDPPNAADSSQVFHYRTGGDANRDGAVDLEDLSDLVSNFGTGAGAQWAQGDFLGATITETGEETGDETVALRDLMLLRNNCDCGGGESLGGGGGGEEMSGGGEGGGGESLLTGDPARIYITTSGSTSGGGALPGTVPSVLLDGPNDSVTLYVWATMGDYSFMNGYSLDIRATDEDIVKATASTIYNPAIVLSNYGNFAIGERWDDEYVTQSELNDDGIGEELLVSGGNAFLLASGGGLNAANDGSDAGGTLDELYDETNGAFLVQSFTLEALAGSAGLSTDIVLYVGVEGFSLDNLLGKSYLTFGLGEDQVTNVDVGATDGTAHATINVAAQEPGALVMSVRGRVGDLVGQDRKSDPVTTRSVNVRAVTRARGPELRIHRQSIDAAHSQSDAGEPRLRAVRRGSRAERLGEGFEIGHVVAGDGAWRTIHA